MALVNSKWYYASIHPQFLRSEVFGYNEIQDRFDRTYDDNSLPKFNEFRTILLKSKRKYFNIKLYGSFYVDHIFPIFQNLANNITSVSLNGLNLLTDPLLDAIFSCSKLEELELSWVPYFSIHNTSRQPLLSLKRMDFETTDLSDSSFNAIMQCAPNLEYLGLDNCNVLVWPQALKRLYPHYRDPGVIQNFSSSDILSNENILNYLKTAKNINKLRIGKHFHIIIDLPNHIKLVYLKLNFEMSSSSFYRLKYVELSNKLASLSTLETLDLKFIPCCIIVSCIPELNNLKCLKVEYTNDQCDHQLQCIRTVTKSLKNKKNLKELKLFSLNDRELTTSSDIANSSLVPLTSYKGPMDTGYQMFRLSQNLTNLKIVNGDIITSTGYQLLFTNLINLRKLVIEKCSKLSDGVLSLVPTSNLKGKEVLWEY